MASQPKKDAIAEAAVDALRGVLQGAGYRTDIGKRVTRRRWDASELGQANTPCASVYWGPSDEAPEMCMGGWRERATLVVEVWVRAANEADADTAALEAEADVKAAMLSDSTLGGTVYAIRPGKVLSDFQEFTDRKLAWKAVGFTVDYNWTASAP